MSEEEEIKKYKNSPAQDLEAWRKIQKKIDVSFRKVSEKKFQDYAQKLKEKNTYWCNTKYPEINKKDIEEDKINTLKKYSGAIMNDNEENDYCMYCTSKMTPCPHKNKKTQIKDKYEYPIVSSSVYGWGEFYDNLGENHNVNSVTRSFYDSTHL